MCGIIGYIGKQDVLPVLLSGLHQLEYRGYDSAGVAVLTRAGLRVHKSAGKVNDLEARLPKRLKGRAGIGHTRWATHGEPNDINAHPHASPAGRIAVVHNGIIENADALRLTLMADGCEFVSETDTEVLTHLIERSGADTLAEATRVALASVEGTYGIAVVSADEPDRIVVARNGSPVVIGIGDKENFVASDVAALVRYTQQVIYLDDGEMAVVEAGSYRTLTLENRQTTKPPSTVSWGQQAYERGNHAHFLHKEISEQPDAVERTLKGRLDTKFNTAHLGGLNLGPRELLDVRRIKILGCGSAYYAGIAGAHLLESLTRIPTDAEARRRVSLPQSGDRERRAVHRGEPVGRDPRYAGGGQGSAAQGRARARRDQRRWQQHRARGRRRGLHPCRARGVGRIDQDLHLHTGCLCTARPAPRPHT